MRQDGGGSMNPITKRREQLGISQAELARRSDIAYQRIWTLEAGKRELKNLTLAVAFKLAAALETTVDKLFGGCAK